jgi:hypothetical protein
MLNTLPWLYIMYDMHALCIGTSVLQELMLLACRRLQRLLLESQQ